MVFLSERQENISVLIVKDDPLEEAAEVDKVDNEVSKKSNVAAIVKNDKPSEKDKKMKMGGDKASKEEVEEDESPKTSTLGLNKKPPHSKKKRKILSAKRPCPLVFHPCIRRKVL